MISWLIIVAVELDLRLPSMVLGKKGFERIVWAFKNVLNSAVTWLFYDFNARRESSAADKGKDKVVCSFLTCNGSRRYKLTFCFTSSFAALPTSPYR